MDNTQNIISLCTGYGGIELGLRLAGEDVRTVAYVEIEAFAIANLVAKIEQGKMDAAPIWTDLKTFDGKPFRGKVHGIIGGYPCQPFSNAGKRQGAEDPRHLWPYILRHIRTIRPVWCFFENVSGHLTLGFDEVFKSLRDMGYKVEAIVASAAEVGAPHLRERLFILGYTEEFRLERQRPQRREQVEPDRTSEELENPEWLGRRGRDNGKLAGQGRTLQTEGSSELGKSESQRCGEAGEYSERSEEWTARANPTSQGLQRGVCFPRITPEDDKSTQEKGSKQTNIVTESIDVKWRWPARPGQEQYDWEEPRTVKPGMGRTVDGFASRVDELRLLGNGVVPQTAALAWKILTEKIKCL